jgi:acetyl esterase/lipase
MCRISKLPLKQIKKTQMKKYIVILLFGLLPKLLCAQDVIHLNGDNNLPTLTVYRPKKDLSKGTAVIICPGGAYAFRTEGAEGTAPAQLFADSGITAFVLDYHLPHGNDTLPLHDAKAAIRYVRIHHKNFKLDTGRIGILGFSAGGHLAASAGTHFSNNEERPDFMVLAYPVISMTDSLTHSWSRSELMDNSISLDKIKLYSNELQVTDNTPGAFITHAMDDAEVSVKNSLYFEAALLQYNAPVQLFLYAHGGHGFTIYNSTANVQWTELCVPWLKGEKWKKIKQLTK